ncbi:GntR family transcriptional regulator [Tuberibacillus sp. Marseille-P3662]|uniref:GntR family transcriptional regulator n=1 Tax=Tuberibacillus sp. Marseille-P3662 TaxID=1965358 RepID=UPI000A1CD7F7|nr:GntR family transcriptional regulator [Tuberibacillus sp. Marseille-P3662]
MRSLYEQVYQSLKQDIGSDKYQAGDRLPSEKEVSESFQVSRITSKKALEKLAAEGFVYRQRGKGTFVAEDKKMNRQAKASNKKPLFGLVVTNFDDSFTSHLISSIEEASSNQCFIILKRSLGDPKREETIVKELLDFGVDGLIIFPAQAEHYSSEILKMVVNQFPFILIDRCFKSVAATSISTKNEEAAKLGINYLFELGHDHIGILSPYMIETTTIEARFNGIIEAYAEKQVRIDRDLWCSDIRSTAPIPQADIEEDIEVIKQHIQKNPHISALFAFEYNIAVLAKRAAEQLDLRVPNDLSILCFDGPEYNVLGWNFTRLKQNEQEIGKLAVNTLMDMCRHEPFTVRNERISATLIEGDSTSRLVMKEHPVQ